MEGPVWIIWRNIILEWRLCTARLIWIGGGINILVGEVEVLNPTLREARVLGWGNRPLLIGIQCIPTGTGGGRTLLVIVLLRSITDLRWVHICTSLLGVLRPG
jgi:hypothetical protein